MIKMVIKLEIVALAALALLIVSLIHHGRHSGLVSRSRASSARRGAIVTFARRSRQAVRLGERAVQAGAKAFRIGLSMRLRRSARSRPCCISARRSLSPPVRSSARASLSAASASG